MSYSLLKKAKGFTLMEVIGVLAITATMAAVLAPSISGMVNRGFADAEGENLEVLMGALEQSILINKQIPTQAINNWVPAIAVFSDLPRNQIEFNVRGFRRRLYIDPQFFTTTNTNFPGYTQTNGLLAMPVSARMMLVSNLTANVPNPPTTNADFSAIWDQTAGAAVLEDELIKIERFNIAKHFNRLLFINSNTQQPFYTLEAGANNSVPAAVGAVDGTLLRFVLKNTQLGLFVNPFPSGALNTQAVVSNDQSYHFKTNGSNWFWERQ